MKIYCIGDSLTEGDYGVPGKRGIAKFIANALTQLGLVNDR